MVLGSEVAVQECGIDCKLAYFQVLGKEDKKMVKNLKIFKGMRGFFSACSPLLHVFVGHLFSTVVVTMT